MGYIETLDNYYIFFLTKYNNRDMNNNLTFKKIKSIKRLKKKQKVYNFDVPGYENYIANGFVVHNCENHKISQVGPPYDVEVISPENLVAMAIKKNCESITLSYNEPTLFYEVLIELAVKCMINDLAFAIKTNAFVNREPWKEICTVTNAMNIDWKGDEDVFKDVTRVNSFVLKDRIEEAYDMGVHIEISLPLYYLDHDFEEQIHRAGEFLSSIDKSIPCHLLRISSSYHYDDFIFHYSQLGRARDVLSQYMTHIYTVV